MGQPFARFEAGVAIILERASIRFGTPLFSYFSVVYPCGLVGLLPTNYVLNDGTKNPTKPTVLLPWGRDCQLGIKGLGQQTDVVLISG